jgi:pimeloyl-ACP methyl ester carboxylesterase
MSLYARTYPDEVAAVILLDSMHPEQIERCRLYLPEEECDPEQYPWWVKTLIRMSPGIIRAEMSGAAETGRQIRAAGPLPSVPLVVVSHGKEEDPDRDRMWAALQQHLAGESPHSIHMVARKSGHNIQSDEPELVVETIRDLVMQAKKDSAAPQ